MLVRLGVEENSQNILEMAEIWAEMAEIWAELAEIWLDLARFLKELTRSIRDFDEIWLDLSRSCRISTYLSINDRKFFIPAKIGVFPIYRPVGSICIGFWRVDSSTDPLVSVVGGWNLLPTIIGVELAGFQVWIGRLHRVGQLWVPVDNPRSDKELRKKKK